MAAKPKKVSRAVFLWDGKDARGKRVKGEMQGANAAFVRAQLRRQQIRPIRVRKKAQPLFSGGQSIKPSDIAVFSRQLATMMSAGVPLVQSFEIVAEGHEKKSMRELVGSVKNDVESGMALAPALAKHPKHFDRLFCSLVAAGEASGNLETLLDKIATYKEKTESLKSKIKKALLYPTLVIIAAVVVTSVLLLFVIPEFQILFENAGSDLPAFTKFVIHISELLRQYWLLFFIVFIGSVVGAIILKRRSQGFSDLLDRLSLKIPVIGNVLDKAAIARFTRTLSTMSASGVPLVEAMESVAGASGNAVFRDAILRMRDDASTGMQLNVSMRQTGLFPNMVVQMVAIGEESGSLEDMLSKVADFYEEEVDNLVDSLTSLLEPLIMGFLGVVVGGLVIAMYLPIFKLGDAF